MCVCLCVFVWVWDFLHSSAKSHCSLPALLLSLSAVPFAWLRIFRMQKMWFLFCLFVLLLNLLFDTIFKFDLTFWFVSGWWRSLWKRLTFNRNNGGMCGCVSERVFLFEGVFVCVWVAASIYRRNVWTIRD